MLSSKANAALMRVKEMEEKYKMKRREQIWNRKENTDSSISSVSINFSENLSAKLKESPKNVSKLKLDIKMPDIRFEGHIEEKKLSSKDKKSTDRVSPKSEDADEVDLDIKISLEDKSSHSSKKQESSISDVITIQEDSSIESVLDDSMTLSKLPSYSKASQQNFSTTSNKLSGRKERIKMDGKLKKRKESDKSSEISRNKLSSYNSSIAKSSKLSEKSKEKISKMYSSVRHLEEEKNIKTLKLINDDQNSKNLNHLGSLKDDSVIKESIDTIQNSSEIISELSHVEESVMTNTKNSVNLSINSVSENAYVIISNSSKHPVAENDYTNDTFEDVSSSIMQSKSELQRKKIIDAENMLIKLHGDVINTMTKKEMSLEIAKSSSRTKTELEDQNATMREVKNEDKSSRSSENNKISDHNSHEYNIKKKKGKIKNTSAKPVKASCNSIGNRKEDKALRLDEKQMHRLQKRIVELRLRQEREDLQKYLHELKDLRLQSSATPSYFSPLEFPNIVEFTQPDAIEIESKPDQCVMLRERVSAIRRWLKDQYILYRDYCTMAQAINAHYVPTTLDDAKKTIRELRKTTIKIR